jgi:hypothetical protein
LLIYTAAAMLCEGTKAFRVRYAWIHIGLEGTIVSSSERRSRVIAKSSFSVVLRVRSRARV